jgi:hypothetical protein
MNPMDLLEKPIQERAEEIKTETQNLKHKGKNRKIVELAEEMFLHYTPFSVIARKLGVSRWTVSLWCTKGGWQEKRRILEDKTSQKLGKKVEEWKDRAMKLTNTIIGTFAQDLKQGKAEVSENGALKAIELQGKIVLPESFNPQINQNISWAELLNKPIEGEPDGE